MRNSWLANKWRKYICPNSLCCSTMKGFLDCNGNNGNDDDTFYPVKDVMLGVQLFMYPDWSRQLDRAKKLPINRIRTHITDKNYNKTIFGDFLNKAKQLGIAVLVTLDNTTDKLRTFELAREVSNNHANQQDLYLYEILNEPNGEISPGNLVSPADYYSIYITCYEEIKQARPDSTIFPAGLIGSEHADIEIQNYISQLKKHGIDKYLQDKEYNRPSGWNLHFYGEQWNEAKDIILLVRKSIDDRVWVTETGCSVGKGIDEQKRIFELSLELCQKYGIEQFFWYGLAHCGNPQNASEDFGLLDDSLEPREMYDYIRRRG